MENEKVPLDKVSPYVKKQFVTKNALLNILLFLIVFCINAFGKIKEVALPLSNINPPWLIFSTLGYMSVSVLIGYGISSLFNKGKERGIKAKYGFLIAIVISIALLINDLERINEKKEQQINSTGDRTSKTNNDIYTRINFKLTMSDMKSVGIAIESYITDWEFAPQVENYKDLNAPFFVPVYIKKLPLKDAWGNDYLYSHEPIGNYNNQYFYSIASSGRDGKFEGFNQAGTYTDWDNKDIIYSNGLFTYFPKIAKITEKYHSTDGKYSIAFPKSPKNSTRKVNMNETGGQIVYSSIVETGDDTFSVYFVDINEFEKMTNDEIKKEFISLRDSSLKNINGRLIQSNYFIFNSTTKKDCIGYDFSADYQNNNNDNCIYIARALIVKNRLYTIIVKTLKNEEFENKVDFVNSFNCFY